MVKRVAEYAIDAEPCPFFVERNVLVDRAVHVPGSWLAEQGAIGVSERPILGKGEAGDIHIRSTDGPDVAARQHVGAPAPEVGVGRISSRKHHRLRTAVADIGAAGYAP